MYYNHDLENRASFRMNEQLLKNFIKYNEDNIDITKDLIFSNLNLFSIFIVDLVLLEITQNDELKQFVKFLYYLDNIYFLELFSIIIIACDLHKGCKILENCVNKINKNSNIAKEIMIVKGIIGF